MFGRFTIDEPESVKDIPPLLLTYGETGRILAGGTELLLAMKQGVLRYEHLIHIKKIPGLDQIHYDENAGGLVLGTLVTHRALEKSDLIKKRFPLIVEMERQIANIRVRTQGTLGGNLCWADPRSDVIILLLALGAKLTLFGTDGERVIPLEDFLVDFYETVLKEGEMLTAIRVPSAPSNTSGVYLRFTRGERPIVGVAALLTFGPKNEVIEDAAISLGCDHPPIRLKEVEEQIKGQAVSEVLANLKATGELVSKKLDIRDDMHASEWYKREMVQVMVERAVREAYTRRIKKIGG